MNSKLLPLSHPMRCCLLSFLLLWLCSAAHSQDTVNFWTLYHAQKDAVDADSAVDYSAWNGRTLYLEIPADAKSIPLASYNDFANITFVVLNRQKDFSLFSLVSEAQPIEIPPSLIDSGDFRSVPQLREGLFLLLLRDQNPWVAERKGYGYAVYRNDLLVVSGGRSINHPVASYNTPDTRVKCSFLPASSDTTWVRNLHLRRHPESTFKTYLLRVANQNNVVLDHISVATPQYHPFKSAATHSLLKGTGDNAITSRTRTRIKLEHDAVISISNSANVIVNDVVIDGTHTVPGSYGYALSVGNTWNATFTRVVADANWGVFGSNNMSRTTLNACDLNRFDIHCYGRDVTCNNCLFRNKQTQFSSFYGLLQFNDCQFSDCVPVRIRGDYNAHTPFDIEFNRCTFAATWRHHHLINIIVYDTTRNARPELYDRNWPNVKVSQMQVQMPWYVSRFDLYHPTGKVKVCREGVGHFSHIQLDSLTIITSPVRLFPVTLRASTARVQPNSEVRLQARKVLQQRRNGQSKKAVNVKMPNILSPKGFDL